MLWPKIIQISKISYYIDICIYVRTYVGTVLWSTGPHKCTRTVLQFQYTWYMDITRLYCQCLAMYVYWNCFLNMYCNRWYMHTIATWLSNINYYSLESDRGRWDWWKTSLSTSAHDTSDASKTPAVLSKHSYIHHNHLSAILDISTVTATYFIVIPIPWVKLSRLQWWHSLRCRRVLQGTS